MSTAVRTTELAAPPATVWATLADFGAISAWAPNVDHSCLLSDRTEGVGAVRRIQAGRTTLVERITTWDPPTTLSYDLEGLPPLVRTATNTWRVEPHGSGSRVSLTSTIDTGSRPFQKLIARAVARRMAKASEQMLAGLEEAVS